MNKERPMQLIAAVLTLLLSPGRVAAAGLTLEDAVRIALRESPAMSVAASGERIAASRVLESREGWRPAVEASQSFVSGNNPGFVFSSLMEQGRFGPANFDPKALNNPSSLRNYRASLSIRYPLFDQGRRAGGAREAAYGVSIAETRSNAARQALILEVIRAYYGALLAVDEQRAAAQAVTSAEADVKRIQDRVDAGLLVQSDLLSARVQLAALQEREVAATGELAIARRALAIAVGRPHEQMEPRGSLALAGFSIGNLDEMLASAVQTRNDLRAASLAEQIAASQRKTADAAVHPRLDAFANWGASGRKLFEHNTDHTVGLVATWRLPGPAVAAARAQAAEGLRVAEALEVETRSAAELEIATAWEHARAAKARQSITAGSVAQADEALRIIRDRYEQGLVPVTELLRAQRALVDARLLSLRSAHDQYIAFAQLLQATGRLVSVEPFQQTAETGGQS